MALVYSIGTVALCRALHLRVPQRHFLKVETTSHLQHFILVGLGAINLDLDTGLLLNFRETYASKLSTN